MISYFLLFYLILYFIAAFALPSYRVWKKTGVNPVTFGGAETAHDYIGKLFKLTMLGLAVVVILNAVVSEIRPFLLPVFWLENQIIQSIGIGLLLLSLGWIILAQVQMGNSWRIGIDEEKKTPLVKTGVFCISRNPIFLGMTITLIGFFFALPNSLTLLALVLGFVLIQIQIRLEEEFLKGVHSEQYNEFCANVRRWL